MAPFSLVKCSASVLNSIRIMLTTCQGFWNDKIWSKFQPLYTILQWCLRRCRRGIFHCHCNDRERELMSRNHMLGATSRPKPSLAKTSQSHQHHSGKFLCCFPLSAPSSLHHPACFLSFSVSHQSHWMTLQPLAVSPASQRYSRSRWPLRSGRLQVIWHLSHSHLLQDLWATDLSVCVSLASHGTCVSETEWEGESERSVCAWLHLRRISRGVEKNELISLSSGGISPNLFSS